MLNPESLERIIARRAELDELEEKLAKQLAEVRVERDELAVAERLLERMTGQLAEERSSARPMPGQAGGHPPPHHPAPARPPPRRNRPRPESGHRPLGHLADRARPLRPRPRPGRLRPLRPSRSPHPFRPALHLEGAGTGRIVNACATECGHTPGPQPSVVPGMTTQAVLQAVVAHASEADHTVAHSAHPAAARAQHPAPPAGTGPEARSLPLAKRVPPDGSRTRALPAPGASTREMGFAAGAGLRARV